MVAYAYQTRITPIRGFRNNARNGSNMALFNTEIRLPIWSSLSKRSIESEFLRDLQCVGFADVGSAWNGSHPYDEANSFNQVVVVQNPITVTVDNNREPIIWGTGFGLRSKFLGYWVRADWCWGVDDGRWQDRIFNLSLQLDF
jgi:outer membrane protein assembly factor BamA